MAGGFNRPLMPWGRREREREREYRTCTVLGLLASQPPSKAKQSTGLAQQLASLAVSDLPMAEGRGERVYRVYL